MITKEKNRTKIICAVVTAISAIVAGGSAFQLHNVQNISQTVNGNVIQILGETGSYVSAGTDLTDSTDELISAYRKVLDENSQYQANQSTLQGQVQSLQNENDDLKNQIQILKETSVYKGYKQDKIEMRGDRAEMSDFPLYLNTVAGGLDRRDQTIGGFSFVVKIYTVPVVEIIG